MSSIAISSSAAAPLPALNIHPHGHAHGHKRGTETDPLTDSTSSTAAQPAAASTRNPFDSLLSTLEQVIGIQPPTQAVAGKSVPAAQASQQSGTAELGHVAQAGQTAEAVRQSMGSLLNLIA